MTNVIFRTDASSDIGTGHLMRCLALAEAVKKLGKVIFVTKDFDRNITKKISDKGFLLETIPGNTELKEDFSMLEVFIRKHGAKIVITDSYDIDGDYLKAVKNEGVVLVSIDDMGKIYFCSDIVINQNLSALKIKYKTEPYTKLLLGPHFAILRDEFISAKRSDKDCEKVENLLVTLGGADPENQTLKVVKALREVKCKLNVTVVVGSAYKFRKELEQEIAVSGLKIDLRSNVDNMAEIMSVADIAISAGGTTCYELAYFGVPNLILVLADNQRDIAQEFEEEGTSINLGEYNNVSQADIVKSLGHLLSDKSKRKSMGQKARKLVDGSGKERIIKELEAIL